MQLQARLLAGRSCTRELIAVPHKPVLRVPSDFRTVVRKSSCFLRMVASEFLEVLSRLGLSQYHDSLVQEAFDSWSILVDITEEDMWVPDPSKASRANQRSDTFTGYCLESSWDIAECVFGMMA
jgi:hypothetical protein